MTIVAEIDLRTSHGEARDQGNRPTCLAFALSDINGHRHDRPAQLSAEHLYRQAAGLMRGWKPGDGLELVAALSTLSAPGQALEASMPYTTVEPNLPLTPCPHCSPLFARTYGRQLPLMDSIENALANDRSVGLVLRLTPDFYSVTADAPYVPFSPYTILGMSHAVIVVGAGHDDVTNERHFLIRNSWGLSWGDSGHAWLPQCYVATHALCAIGD